MAYEIQLRHDTAANWTSANPTLAQGEAGYETDTAKMKIGDGSTAWTSLPYFTPGGSPLTTKGDVYGYSTTNARIPVGTDGQVLTADSTQTLGLKWAAASGSSPLTTKGDVYTYSTTNARLAVGSNGQVLTAASGATTGNDWEYPPGHAFDYVQITASVTGITGTTEGTASTCITGNSVSYDGSTEVCVEAWAPGIYNGSSGHWTFPLLLIDTTVIGRAVWVTNTSSTFSVAAPYLKVFYTPSAGSHQFILKAFVDAGSGQWNAGAGGTGNYLPSFLRVTKA